MYTNTWQGKLRSNTPFPHNVLYIVSFYVFSAVLASDLEDLGLFSRDNLISIRISRVCCWFQGNFNSWSSQKPGSCDAFVRIMASAVALWRKQLRCNCCKAHGNVGWYGGSVCRNYVKSHTTVRGYSAQHAHKTQVYNVTHVRETREWSRRDPKELCPLVLSRIPVYLLVININ